MKKKKTKVEIYSGIMSEETSRKKIKERAREREREREREWQTDRQTEQIIADLNISVIYFENYVRHVI